MWQSIRAIATIGSLARALSTLDSILRRVRFYAASAGTGDTPWPPLAGLCLEWAFGSFVLHVGFWLTRKRSGAGLTPTKASASTTARAGTTPTPRR